MLARRAAAGVASSADDDAAGAGGGALDYYYGGAGDGGAPEQPPTVRRRRVVAVGISGGGSSNGRRRQEDSEEAAAPMVVEGGDAAAGEERLADDGAADTVKDAGRGKGKKNSEQHCCCCATAAGQAKKSREDVAGVVVVVDHRHHDHVNNGDDGRGGSRRRWWRGWPSSSLETCLLWRGKRQHAIRSSNHSGNSNRLLQEKKNTLMTKITTVICNRVALMVWMMMETILATAANSIMHCRRFLVFSSLVSVPRIFGGRERMNTGNVATPGDDSTISITSAEASSDHPTHVVTAAAADVAAPPQLVIISKSHIFPSSRINGSTTATTTSRSSCCSSSSNNSCCSTAPANDASHTTTTAIPPHYTNMNMIVTVTTSPNCRLSCSSNFKLPVTLYHVTGWRIFGIPLLMMTVVVLLSALLFPHVHSIIPEALQYYSPKHPNASMVIPNDFLPEDISYDEIVLSFNKTAHSIMQDKPATYQNTIELHMPAFQDLIGGSLLVMKFRVVS